MILKLVFTAQLLDAQHQRNSVENKPVSSLVCYWERHLTGFPHLGVVNWWPATLVSISINRVSISIK